MVNSGGRRGHQLLSQRSCGVLVEGIDFCGKAIEKETEMDTYVERSRESLKLGVERERGREETNREIKREGCVYSIDS